MDVSALETLSSILIQEKKKSFFLAINGRKIEEGERASVPSLRRKGRR